MGGLPRDLEQQIAKQRGMPTQGGIGSRAPQNAGTAAARQAAMGNLPAGPQEEEPVEGDQAGEDEEAEPGVACSSCKHVELNADARFCSSCGESMLVSTDPAKALGISDFSEDDLEQYLFKGFVTRTIKLAGKHTVTLRSSIAKDMRLIDDLLLNTEFVIKKAKDAGEGGRASSEFIGQMQQLARTALAVISIDEKPIINKLVKDPIDELALKMQYLEERGSALIDTLSAKVVLFNVALSKYIRKESTVLGS